MKLLNNKITYRIIVPIYMLGILRFSFQQYPASHHAGQTEQFIKNFLHMPAYGVLTYLIIKCFTSLKPRVYLDSFIIAYLFGVINEIIQATVPTRTASFSDTVVNGIGAILALVFVYKYEDVKSRRNK